MPGRFTDLELRDARLIGRAVSDSSPPNEKASIADASAMEWGPAKTGLIRDNKLGTWSAQSDHSVGLFRFSYRLAIRPHEWALR
jgi:hypothetical protein